MSKVILVTGGLGFIGSHIVAALLEDKELINCSVHILDNESNCARPQRILSALEDLATKHNRKLCYTLGDVTQSNDVERVFADQTDPIDCVIHCAGVKSVNKSISNPIFYYQTNVSGSLVVLEAMDRHGCNQFIFSSSATVYGEPEYVPVTEDHPLKPINPYGRSKMLVETIVRDWHAVDPTNRRVAMLRYMNPVGAHASATLGELPIGTPDNLQPYIAQVALGVRSYLQVFGSDFETRDGTGVRDYIHVVDLAEAHIAAMKRMPTGYCKAVNIGRGIGISVLEMHAAFERASGKVIAIARCERRAGDSAQVYCDASCALKDFGWSSRLDIDAMCQSTWKFLTLFWNEQ